MISNLIFDPRENIIPGYNFMVTIGSLILSFAKVSNMTAQIEYDSVVEGGNNDYPHLFKKPKSSPDTLILEKGVRSGISDIGFDMLMEGMQVELVTILVLKNGIELQKAFYIKKGLIVKRQFSDLDAMNNQIFIETLEIAHTGLVKIDV